ncbi:hypothetical protein ONS96_002165 [Cadophora gregata f. sp. sojae]|nr:hypothetical protein ONS96_002165 [Cadophora gregata f. sp. sojae]
MCHDATIDRLTQGGQGRKGEEWCKTTIGLVRLQKKAVMHVCMLARSGSGLVQRNSLPCCWLFVRTPAIQYCTTTTPLENLTPARPKHQQPTPTPTPSSHAPPKATSVLPYLGMEADSLLSPLS